MSRPNPLVLFSILLASLAGFAWIGLRPGALLISAHEGDTYHLLDILFRMDRGQVPHQDFMTPIGILAFLPITAFMERGFGVGQSILFSQVLVGTVLLPFVFYAVWTRLTPKMGYFFGAFTMLLVVAVTFGGTEPGLSISMHYNRWAWAIAYVVIILAFAPARGAARPLIDGILIGAGLSALVFVKVTFFVALVPGIATVLLMRGSKSTIAATLITGVIIAIGATLVLGLSFWSHYVSDLLIVSSSDVRPNAGVSMSDLLTQSKSIAFTVVGFLIFLLVKRAGHYAEAFGLLLLVPGFFFITYQNFGNDPKWLVPMIALIVVLRPVPGEVLVNGADMHVAFTALATAAGLLFMHSITTLVMSPLRHAVQGAGTYEPLIPNLAGHQDILVRSDRGFSMTAQIELDVPGSAWFSFRELASRSEPLELAGVEIPQCEIMAGSLASFVAINRDLSKASLPPQSSIFVADVLTALWLFGDFAPVTHGAPWYYGDLPGVETADYVLVPKCGFLMSLRNTIIEDLNASDMVLTPIRDNELYALFSTGKL